MFLLFQASPAAPSDFRSYLSALEFDGKLEEPNSSRLESESCRFLLLQEHRAVEESWGAVEGLRVVECWVEGVEPESGSGCCWAAILEATNRLTFMASCREAAVPTRFPEPFVGADCA